MVRKHVSPSRTRYEGNNPVISFRIPRASAEKLRTMQKQTGLSLAKLAQRALEIDAKSTEEAYNRGYADGYGRFKLLCPICRKPMHFDIKAESDAKAKAFLAKAFADANWAHTSCPETRK